MTSEHDASLPRARPDRPARRSWLIAACVLAYGAVACMFGGDTKVAVQSWTEDRGPVVPHSKFPADCSLCHTGESWHDIRSDFAFDHEKETGVRLEGAHARAECLRCHNDRGPVAVFADRGCGGCHEDVHQTRQGTNCADCHDQDDWSANEQVAKHNRTRFPLVGAHVATPCWRCHVGAEVGNFQRADIQCVSCHMDDLARATNPDHQAQGWVDHCDRCHIPTTWTGAGFNHAGFPLTGQHKVIACTACHTTGTFDPLPTNCAACHIDEYNATTDPNHSALGFPTNCQQCHSTNAWEPATFNHAGITNNCVMCHLADYQGTTDPNHAAAGYPTTCEQCHNTNAWQRANFNHAGITNNCVTCHLADYQGTNDPNHLAAGYPTTCEQCHNTNAWQRANFNHAGITNNCVACHFADYQNTNDPNHAAAGFPTSCETCHHSTTTWQGATFNHSFPINSGPHHSLSCADCHLRSGSFRTFSCTHCHAHNQAEMANEHNRVGGYVWQSSACLSCHPNGQGD